MNITAFTANNACQGDLTIPIFTYSGFKSDGTTAYVYSTDNIGVNPATGAI